jgi:hypothetical protein
MKFAVVEGKRGEALPGLSATCPSCGNAMIAKCGQLRVWHWSHRGTRTCDRWWEPETEWHRTWKDRFPVEWQEITQWSEDGERHIADVKTESGVVIEFQHSHLRREERESRENFYQRMVWVVDGLRRKQDRSRFFASLAATRVVNPKPLTFWLSLNEHALLREWSASRVPVYFDFGDGSEPGDAQHFPVPVLWLLVPGSSAYLRPVRKDSFQDAYVRRLPLRAYDRSAYFALTARKERARRGSRF